MAYPTDLNPTLKTDWANNTPVEDTHPDEHNNVALDVTALKAKVGANGSAVTTSHDYKLGEVISSDRAVGKDATQTLTNKTLTSPTITNKTSTGTDAGTETLNNKTLNSPTIVTPTISGTGFTNAQHAHTGATSGGQLTESALNLSDNTTNNVSTARHGFVPKAPNNTSQYLRGDGTWSTISGITKFGGTGVDGALTISSGTTNIDLGGVQFFVRNYTSISITGTGALTFTNPHANGTLITLKSQGNVTITSSASPNIQCSSLGANTDLNGVSSFSVNRKGSVGVSASNTGGGGGGGGSIANDGVAGSAGTGSSNGAGGAGGLGTFVVSILAKTLSVGAGGGTGGTGVGAGAGAGGRGGGALLIECAGALNSTGAIFANGANGSAATGGQSGGGGGGGGGAVIILGNTVTASSSTITVTGGAGGAGHSGGFSGGAGGAGGAGYSFIGTNTEFQ